MASDTTAMGGIWWCNLGFCTRTDLMNAEGINSSSGTEYVFGSCVGSWYVGIGGLVGLVTTEGALDARETM